MLFRSLAAKLALPYRTWDKQQLGTVEAQLSTRSEYVYNTVGVYGVAESAALYSAQDYARANGGANSTPLSEHEQIKAELVMNKQKTTKATCAIARAYLG